MTIHLLLSPAKTLDFEQDTLVHQYFHDGYLIQKPALIDQAKQIMQVLRQKSQTELSEMMELSEKLSKLNHQRFQDWQGQGKYPAIYAYQGDVYQGLKAETFDARQLQLANDRIHIISGLYGLLSPFDGIEAYRLEMGTALQVGIFKDLYAFWGSTLTDHLKQKMKTGDLLLNLASVEYSQAIDFEDIEKAGIDVYHAQFLDEKNQKFKIISFYAKYARGLMGRFCILEGGEENLDKIKRFNLEGYVFDEQRTENESRKKSGQKTLVWMRHHSD